MGQQTTNSASQGLTDEAQAHRSAYLMAMRQVPGAVAIVACDHKDARGGLAATAWTSVCADPPMMLVCVNQSASAHDMFKAERSFTINFLSADDTETVAIFSAQRGLSGSDRFLPEAWRAGKTGQPVLNDASAAFECTLVESHVYGTHSLLIGRVEAVHANPDRAGLLYLDGGYASAQKLDPTA